MSEIPWAFRPGESPPKAPPLQAGLLDKLSDIHLETIREGISEVSAPPCGRVGVIAGDPTLRACVLPSGHEGGCKTTRSE